MNRPAVTDPLAEVLDRAIALGGPSVVPAGGDSGSAPFARLVEALGGSSAAAVAIEAVREGFLCHHDAPRTLTVEDEDLGLLAGDLLYAIGLRELALAGDPRAVAILADLIRLVSQRVGSSRRSATSALWLGQTTALAVGSDDRHRAALEAVEAGRDEAGERLSAWSREVTAKHGAREALSEAAQALQ